MKDTGLLLSLLLYKIPTPSIGKLLAQTYTSIIGMRFYLMVPTNLEWGGPFTRITYQAAQWLYSVGSILRWWGLLWPGYRAGPWMYTPYH